MFEILTLTDCRLSPTGIRAADSENSHFGQNRSADSESAVLETASRGSLSRNGSLAKSNGLRYGGYALKGLSEDLRFYDDCRRLDRRVLAAWQASTAIGASRIFSVKLPADLGVCPRADGHSRSRVGRHRRLGFFAAASGARATMRCSAAIR